MKRLIFALPLLLAAMPALAAGPDPLADSLATGWSRMQEDNNNLRNALIVALQERGQMQGQIADLRQKCGDRCVDPAPTTPAPAPPPPEAPKP